MHGHPSCTTILSIVVRMLRMITDNRRNLFLQRVNTTSLIVGQADTLATISLTDATIPITASPLAYRPMFSGNHRSMLGTLFINIEEVFPCVAGTDYNAICRTFSDEDDGFRGGRAVLDSGDDGNTFRVFGGTIETYGVTFQNCPILDLTCLPHYHSFTIACYLPATCDPYM